MKRRQSKCVRQRVEVWLGGVAIKTTRRWTTKAYASRQLREASAAESVLNAGGPITRTRSVAGGITVIVEWQYFPAKDHDWMKLQHHRTFDLDGRPVL